MLYNKETLAKKFYSVAASYLGVELDTINPSRTFVGDYQMDSLDDLELIMDVEDEFNVNLPDEVVENVVTVGDALAVIEQLLKQDGRWA